jgi:predicted patatin/cPLA2 family phospholipase
MKYDTICLSSGGIRGLCFIGALDYINKNVFKLNIIKHFVGTSVGAILCFLLSINYSIDEITNFYFNFNFNLLYPYFNLYNLLTIKAYDNGNKLVFVLSKLLQAKYNIKDISFIDHYKLTGKKLTIIGTNYNTGKEACFNYELTPNMSVITACRITTTIPIIYQLVLYNNEYYMDGGYTNSFPLDYCNIDSTLGLYIINTDDNNVNNIFSIISSTINISLNTLNSIFDKFNNIFNYKKLKIIKITNDNTLYLTSFNIDNKIKKDLYNSGAKCAYEFFINDNI